MPRVICNLPNASDEIGGVKFKQTEDGRRISEEVSAEAAERFASIPGYELAGADDAPQAPRLTKAQQKAAEKAAAEAAEKEAAEKAAAEKAEAESAEKAEKEAAEKTESDGEVF